MWGRYSIRPTSRPPAISYTGKRWGRHSKRPVSRPRRLLGRLKLRPRRYLLGEASFQDTGVTIKAPREFLASNIFTALPCSRRGRWSALILPAKRRIEREDKIKLLPVSFSVASAGWSTRLIFIELLLLTVSSLPCSDTKL